MSKPRRVATSAQRLTGALALSLVISGLLLAALLRPANRAPIPAVWEPRPAIPDLIAGPPGPAPR